MDQSRYENDAEHSWHIALAAMLFLEYADDPKVNVLRVIKMLLVHDLVEIDAGDTFAYDAAGRAGQHERETRAADRIFGLLPPDQARAFRAIWDEFEEGKTAEARFAAAVDRFQPMLLNLNTGGAAWRKHGITEDRVRARNAHIAEGSALLWEHMAARISEAVADGLLDPPKPGA